MVDRSSVRSIVSLPQDFMANRAFCRRLGAVTVTQRLAGVSVKWTEGAVAALHESGWVRCERTCRSNQSVSTVTTGEPTRGAVLHLVRLLAPQLDCENPKRASMVGTASHSRHGWLALGYGFVSIIASLLQGAARHDWE